MKTRLMLLGIVMSMVMVSCDHDNYVDLSGVYYGDLESITYDCSASNDSITKSNQFQILISRNNNGSYRYYQVVNCENQLIEIPKNGILTYENICGSNSIYWEINISESGTLIIRQRITDITNGCVTEKHGEFKK